MERAQQKEALFNEYSLGGISIRKLALKHGYSISTVKRWLMSVKKARNKLGLLQLSKFAEKDEGMPTDVKQLQDELRTAQLEIALLKAMIDISDEQYGTNIRKKAGTRPS
jgi:transposase